MDDFIPSESGVEQLKRSAMTILSPRKTWHVSATS